MATVPTQMVAKEAIQNGSEPGYSNAQKPNISKCNQEMGTYCLGIYIHVQ